MSKRIYIGNLPWSVTKARLEELFSSYGEMEDALVVANKYTGRSRGFGFITFKDDGNADKAIEEMDGKEVEGRALLVKEARPRRDESEATSASAESGKNEEKGDKKESEGKSEKSGEKKEKVEEKPQEEPKDEAKDSSKKDQENEEEKKTVLEKEAAKESEGKSEDNEK